MMVREIDEKDVEQTIEVYRAVYGDDFPFQEFYDARWVKKGVFDDDIEWVVSEQDGTVVGSAAVMLNVGDVDDLIGEFGRLVVHPDCRSAGMGTKLIEDCVRRATGRIEFGFAETRAVHPGAQKICQRTGFVPVGFEPLAYQLGPRRESVIFMVLLSENARKLRKNNPRTISSVYPLGCVALEKTGFAPDLVVDGEVESYSVDDGLKMTEPQDEQMVRLLRIGRGRSVDREVFGGVRLEYGYLKLTKYKADYLVACKEGQPVGAAGFVNDPIDKKVRLFELIALSDAIKGALLKAFVQHVDEVYSPAYVQADVSAHAPRMQQSLWELGFVPVAYCPAMVFENVERLDVVKMVRLTVPWALGHLDMLEPCAQMKELVEEAFEERHRGSVIADVARQVRIFEGLGDWDIEKLRAICVEKHFPAGGAVFSENDPGKSLFIVMEGEVRISADEEGDQVLARVGAGEVFGELALVDGLPRSASATCSKDSRLLVIQASDFHQLAERHPAIGKTVLLNMCRTMSARLRAADAALETYHLKLAGNSATDH